jgi:hypothetical protein
MCGDEPRDLSGFQGFYEPDGIGDAKSFQRAVGDDRIGVRYIGFRSVIEYRPGGSRFFQEFLHGVGYGVHGRSPESPSPRPSPKRGEG